MYFYLVSSKFTYFANYLIPLYFSLSRNSVPAYAVLFFIPFTYSILRGVAFGYVLYIFIGLFTGDHIINGQAFIKDLFTFSKPKPKIVGGKTNTDLESSANLDEIDKPNAFNKFMNILDMEEHAISMDTA